MRCLLPLIIALFLWSYQALAFHPVVMSSGTTGTSKTLDDSYDFANDGGDNTVYSTYPEAYQSLTSGGGTLDSVVIDLKKVGSPTGSAYAKIYAHTGTYGTSSEPTGSILATSDALNVAGLTTSYVETPIVFSGAERIELSSQYYCLVIEYTGGDGSNYLAVSYDASSPTHDGNQGYETSGSGYTPQSSYDMCFEIYVYR